MMAAKKKAATKRAGSGGVSHAELVAYVRLLRRWIIALKTRSGAGGWTIEDIEKADRPDPVGGPPGI
jgi:hypothetical protein